MGHFTPRAMKLHVEQGVWKDTYGDVTSDCISVLGLWEYFLPLFSKCPLMTLMKKKKRLFCFFALTIVVLLLLMCMPNCLISCELILLIQHFLSSHMRNGNTEIYKEK